MSLSWSVPDLLQFKEEGLSFHEEVVLPLELFRTDPEIRSIVPVDVKDVVEFSKQSLTFHLRLTGKMVLPCAVTLEDVDYPFQINTAETFLLSAGTENEIEGEFVHQIENDQVDLIPYLVEAILVEKPMRVVSEKARDSRRFSGNGWTLVNEESSKQQIDPRLEKLRKFFDN
ncbi:YceD family protein [Sporolactobacillus shoreicorticis]|uniref:YceD family protein n=1 Tax=Sporolactobacillus shoreicorticis TaxID=1923877 RepID=A0ABW5S4M0_9BACL|nr:YceD family protein [Sporolactobacillus shoreicorticis]MCO7126287.1 YceD family protein [Sporolactobacillus shoreicorticis]